MLRGFILRSLDECIGETYMVSHESRTPTMNISLPERVTYEALRILLEAHFNASQRQNAVYTFNWSCTKWVNLPELISILTWSSRLVHQGSEVTWLLPNPIVPQAGLSDARERVRPFLRNEDFNAAILKMDELRGLAIKRALYAGQRRSVINKLLDSLSNPETETRQRVAEWLNTELGPLESGDMLGFFWRYNVFQQATNAGVRMHPDPATLPYTPFQLGEDSPCLELISLRSSTDVTSAVDKLSDRDELQRILGAYSNMDIVSRGALAHILINELGRNIEEHAKASAAWLCTRLVKSHDFGFQFAGDPGYGVLSHMEEAVLEVVVCDDGVGLANTIASVIEHDPRKAVTSKYLRDRNNKFAAKDLIDYSFDRLSSSKRDIADLVNWDTSGMHGSLPLASGLYWIWSLVRTYSGAIQVRSSGVCGYYDFTREASTDAKEQTGKGQFCANQYGWPCAGTMLRIFLPIRQTPVKTDFKPAQLTTPRYHGNEVIVWAGHLAFEHIPVATKRTAAMPTEADILPLPVKSSPEVSLFQKLQREHAKLNDKGILVLNLCGAREQWTKRAAAPLCHFFLHMNYTGPVANSAMVLWNVPHNAADLFEQGIELARRSYGHLTDKLIGAADKQEEKAEFARRSLKHLKDLHRVALLIYDNQEARIVCGSEQMEKALARLAHVERLSIDDLLLGTDVQRSELEQVVARNTHIFHKFGTDEIGLLAWRQDLRGRVWKDDMEWLDGVLQRSVSENGIQRKETKAYFRLPSSGLLVNVFYSFTTFLCNWENCARLTWMLHEMLLQLEAQSGKTAQWLVAVTRSAAPLAQHLNDNYLKSRGKNAPRMLFASTVETLERMASEMKAEGNAIFLTDVISTGALSERVGRSLKLKWIGTIALLDTRENIKPDLVKENAGPALGISYLKTGDLLTGKAYVLKYRKVRKTNPLKIRDAKIISVDPINVTIVKPPVINDNIKRIWPYLERAPDALKVGHYCSRGSSHYGYYINIGKLLNAPRAGSPGEQVLRDLLLKTIQDDLRSAGYNPDQSLIIHPPRDESEAHMLAEIVQRNTDILYRHVLHRDSFANQQIFSTFVEHGAAKGANANGRVALVLDDGTNTGETLMGLIDAAAFDEPKEVLAYCVLARLPLHKLDFYNRMDYLGRRIAVKSKFSVRLTIPVYSQHACPICRFAGGLDEVSHRSALLSRHAQQLKKEIEPIRIDATQATEEELREFLWKCASGIEAARFREALELAGYFADEHEYIINSIAAATRQQNPDHHALLNIAFVVACEPDLLAAPIFTPHLERLGKAVEERLKECQEVQMVTLFTLGYHIAFQKLKRGQAARDCHSLVRKLALAVLSRREQTIACFGRLLASTLAEYWPESEAESDAHLKVCNALGTTLKRELASAIKASRNYIKAFGYFLSCAFLRDINREAGALAFDPEAPVPENLFDLTSKVAAKFWRHASKHCDKNISSIVENSQKWSDRSRNAISDAISDLCHAFDSLQELRYRINKVEWLLRTQKGVSSSANIHWKSDNMSSALNGFATAIALVAEKLENAGAERNLEFRYARELEAAWQTLSNQLTYAFDDIFPELISVADWCLEGFGMVTGLPETALDTTALDTNSETEIRQTDSRVFVPRAVLEAFCEETIRNLRTSAYANWTSEQKENDAKVVVAISRAQDATCRQFLGVSVRDNGPLHNKGEVGRGVQGRALKEIHSAIIEYGGKLEGPITKDGQTHVTLWMNHRYIKQSE